VNNKIWKIQEPNARLQSVLCDDLGISPVFAQLLINRDIKSVDAAHEFLFGGLSFSHDPFLMKDMGKSVERIKKAVENKEKIMIYGDYDADGVTATALLSYVLKDLGAEYECFIPNRLEEGYGVNIRAIALARDHGVKLIITVDCGINAFREVECANEYGIDVIITDHHEITGDIVPPAYSVINVHQKDCGYPFKGLAGVGVAYKLGKALLGNGTAADLHLDLVAIGTIADVAPISNENRILVKAGLKKLSNTEKPGIIALKDVARLKNTKITCRHVGFIIGPRINAMGRVSSANIALDLLMCTDTDRAKQLAAVLEQENKNRQTIEKELLDLAKDELKNMYGSGKINSIVLSGDNWHQGVIGIVASRITDVFEVPTILVAVNGEKGKGSGRSAGGVNLFEALKQVKEYLVDFGGHEGACGLKMEKKNIDDFRKAFESVVKNMLDQQGNVPAELRADICIPFSRIDMKLLKELELLMPYGAGNPEPVFATREIIVKTNPREIGKNGYKFFAGCGNITYEAVSFGGKVQRPRKDERVDMLYRPGINSWDGIDTIQLNIVDIMKNPA